VIDDGRGLGSGASFVDGGAAYGVRFFMVNQNIKITRRFLDFLDWPLFRTACGFGAVFSSYAVSLYRRGGDLFSCQDFFIKNRLAETGGIPFPNQPVIGLA